VPKSAEKFFVFFLMLLAHINNPGVSAHTMRQRARDMLIPFRSVLVFHVIKFTKGGPLGEISDSAHTRPEAVDLHTQIISARFDTVIVHEDSPQEQGNKGSFQLYQN
jgi:alkyl hydroperoxide reductase subunit AhpC